jgi:hypothetical protein
LSTSAWIFPQLAFVIFSIFFISSSFLAAEPLCAP